jgi:cytochrome c peroxidase
MLGGEDNRPNSMGVNGQTGGRSAPTVWNSAFNKVQFWDGRADSLEAQAAGPVRGVMRSVCASRREVRQLICATVH